MEFMSGLNRPQPETAVSRRGLLASALPAALAATVAPGQTASAAGPAAPPSANLTRGPRMESRLFYYDDPADHQRQSFRILRNTLDDADVLFWYHFTMFTVPAGRAPQAVVRWEGIELSHHRRLSEGVYRIHGHNLSFPRDLRTGRWTDTAVNPVTGNTVAVPPMALTEDPGYLYTPDGVIPLDNPAAPPRMRIEQFLIEDDLIKLEQVRLPPASWPATFVETSANWSNRQLFEETDLPSLPAGTAGGYVFPWPAWLQMGDEPGHMFATWSGRKLGSVAELPPAYLKRAEADHAELLAVDLSVFAEPLPAVLKARIGS
jgi:hypothetical protein